jgi:hypothetical protein
LPKLYLVVIEVQAVSIEKRTKKSVALAERQSGLAEEHEGGQYLIEPLFVLQLTQPAEVMQHLLHLLLQFRSEKGRTSSDHVHVDGVGPTRPSLLSCNFLLRTVDSGFMQHFLADGMSTSKN